MKEWGIPKVLDEWYIPIIIIILYVPCVINTLQLQKDSWESLPGGTTATLVWLRWCCSNFYEYLRIRRDFLWGEYSKCKYSGYLEILLEFLFVNCRRVKFLMNYYYRFACPEGISKVCMMRATYRLRKRVHLMEYDFDFSIMILNYNLYKWHSHSTIGNTHLSCATMYIILL